MNFILFDHQRLQLLPFTHTRSVADVRCGIFTMRERWEFCLEQTCGTLTEQYLMPLYPPVAAANSMYLNSAVFADRPLVNAIAALKEGQKLVSGTTVIAASTTRVAQLSELESQVAALVAIDYGGELQSLAHIWDIFSKNEFAIKLDFELLTHGRISAALPENIIVSQVANVFVEAGAVIHPGSVINASTGPIYIGKDAEIMEGCLLRGPLALCEHATIKMGAKIYGATTIGPGCKVGGEISNVVFFANSNKGHDGFLGNSVIGEWCNLGADTNSSNLKNNYDVVKIWDEQQGQLVNTNLTFCGLLMGDHSKCGINTMFNTGTVVGVSANIYGGGFPEKFIPSFSWGGSDGMVTYDLAKALETANRMMNRRGKKLSEAEIGMYNHVFELTVPQRSSYSI